MNAIQIIKQNAKMWLGPKYSNKEYEIFKEGVEPFANRCIKEILEANNDEKKAPRTGFPVPTEEEKKEFDGLLTAINILKKAKPLEPVKYFDLRNIDDKFLGKSVGEFVEEVDKKRIDNMFNCKKCKCKKVRSSRGLVCPKHEIK